MRGHYKEKVSPDLTDLAIMENFDDSNTNSHMRQVLLKIH